MQPGMTVSAVARLYGVAPSLLFQWRRRMSEGGQEDVRADEEVVPLDLPRFCAAPLITYCAAKKMNHGHRQDG